MKTYTLKFESEKEKADARFQQGIDIPARDEKVAFLEMIDCINKRGLDIVGLSLSTLSDDFQENRLKIEVRLYAEGGITPPKEAKIIFYLSSENGYYQQQIEFMRFYSDYLNFGNKNDFFPDVKIIRQDENSVTFKLVKPE